jgi:hypothetical protein
MEGKTTPPSSPEEACPHRRSARRWPVKATTGDLSQASSVTLGRDREGGREGATRERREEEEREGVDPRATRRLCPRRRSRTTPPRTHAPERERTTNGAEEADRGDKDKP